MGRPHTQPSKKRRWPAIVFVGLLVTAALVGRFVDAPDIIGIAREATAEAGHWAPFAFGGGYVLATLVGIPGTPLTVLCALIFGTGEAFLIMVAATTLATTIAFFIARHVARPSIEAWVGNTKQFETVKGWVERSPWIAIPFVRVMPIFPYALINYGLGLTRVSFWTYIAASEIGMLPINALLVGMAGSLYRFMVRGETPWWVFAATAGAGLAILVLGLLGKRFFARQETQPA